MASFSTQTARNAEADEGGALAMLCVSAALIVALATVGGSLYLTWGLGLKACPLCFYQRAFAMGSLGVLVLGLLTGAIRPGRLALVTLPLTTAALGVALFHVRLELIGKLECPKGIMELGTAPQQSLAGLALLWLLLLGGVLTGLMSGGRKWLGLGGGLLLGGLLAAASCTSNPPLSRPAPEAYDKPPDGCRPPLSLSMQVVDTPGRYALGSDVPRSPGARTAHFCALLTQDASEQAVESIYPSAHLAHT